MATAPLAPIPREAPIVQPKTGAINLFFRQQWESLRLLVSLVATLGTGFDATGQAAALTGQLLQTITTAGLYRVTYYIRKTTADGVSSAVGFVWHWTESGIPQTLTDATLTTDTTGAVKSNSALLQVDANTSLTFDVSYASNTPGLMKYRIAVRVEQLSS